MGIKVYASIGIASILSIYLYISDRLLSPMLPRIPTVVAQLLLLRLALKRVAKCAIFPGCTTFWKYSLQQQLATPALTRLSRQVARPDFSAEGLVKVLKRQAQSGTLTKSQRTFLAALEQDSAKSAVLAMIDENLHKYTSRLAMFTQHTPLIQGLDFMRAQLELGVDAKSFTVGNVDVILIPAPPLDRMPEDAKVVLFCNPNAGFFENLAFNPEFVELYAALGYSFCSFNYRGYNRSRGWPSAANVAQDAALVLQFLRTHLGFKRVGVHGRSIGGICAVHLGSRVHGADLDFVVADRTFSTLSAAARAMLGSWAQWAVVLLQEDSADLGLQWLSIKCPKIAIYADDDEIIRPSASLISAVARRIAPTKFQPAELRKLRNLANALVFGPNDGDVRTIGRSYNLTEDTRETREETRAALVELLGLPDGEVYNVEDIEGAAASLQVWGVGSHAAEHLRSVSETLEKSDQPEAEIFRKSFVDVILKSLDSQVDLKTRGLLVRTDAGHNDSLSVREKATLSELIRSSVKENI